MTPRHPEHPDASAELLAAAEWLEARDTGLGHALFAAVADALHAIDRHPEAWPAFPGWNRLPLVRTKSTTRFPYRVVYFIGDDGPVILAYAHWRRQPDYWLHRVEEMDG